MSNNKHRGIFAGKGYYIALILCAVAIGITGYVYQRNTREPDPVSMLETEEAVPALQTEGEDDVAVLSPQTTPTSPRAESKSDTPKSTQPTALKTTSPLAGETLADYSMEALSYNETTRDWRVHNGIDIAAEEGTPVFAAADGEVVSVYEDDVLGYTVVIRHTGGYTSCYCSLGSEISVTPGQQVHMGQAIGVVGQTALVESAMGPHLHFSVTWQDEAMDPREFLAMGQ